MCVRSRAKHMGHWGAIRAFHSVIRAPLSNFTICAQKARAFQRAAWSQVRSVECWKRCSLTNVLDFAVEMNFATATLFAAQLRANHVQTLNMTELLYLLNTSTLSQTVSRRAFWHAVNWLGWFHRITISMYISYSTRQSLRKRWKFYVIPFYFLKWKIHFIYEKSQSFVHTTCWAVPLRHENSSFDCTTRPRNVLLFFADAVQWVLVH